MNGIIAREQHVAELERENAELRAALRRLLAGAQCGPWENTPGDDRSLLRPTIADCRRASELLNQCGSQSRQDAAR